MCENNPALRADPTVPVAAEDVKRLPINPQSKRFDKSAFVYEADADQYRCPAGKTLSRAGTETRQTAGRPVLDVIYFGDACKGCELAPQCRKNPESEQGRKVTRDEHEEARARHREHRSTPESAERYKQRQHFGEMPFAVMKVCFDMRRFLLRGLAGVQAEWQWCCTAFNLKKLMNLIAASRAEFRKMAQKLNMIRIFHRLSSCHGNFGKFSTQFHQKLCPMTTACLGRQGRREKVLGF